MTGLETVGSKETGSQETRSKETGDGTAGEEDGRPCEEDEKLDSSQETDTDGLDKAFCHFVTARIGLLVSVRLKGFHNDI